MLVGLAVVADDFVAVVLGPKWHSAALVIQVLAWVGILQSLQGLNTGILEALGRARTIFRYTVVFFVAHLIAFVVGVQWGIVGVAVGYAISTTIIEPAYLWLTARAVGISPWTFLQSVAGVFEASALLGRSSSPHARGWCSRRAGAPAARLRGARRGALRAAGRVALPELVEGAARAAARRAPPARQRPRLTWTDGRDSASATGRRSRPQAVPPPHHDGPLLLVCSSGGHLLQLVGLREAFGGLERVWVTFDKPDARSLLAGERVVHAFGPTNRNIPNLLRNLRLARRVLRRPSGPRAIVSTGAGVAVPFAWIGAPAGVPRRLRRERDPHRRRCRSAGA